MGMSQPSRVGLLPCLFIVILWLLLPLPKLQHGPALDPTTRNAALKAMQRTKNTAAVIKSRISLSKRRTSQSQESSNYLYKQYQSWTSAGSDARTEDDADISNDLKQLSSTTAASNRMLIVTGIAPKPCKLHEGDFLTMLSIKNKQDYARMHGYDFYMSTHLSDVNLVGAWNKVALIRDLLKSQSQYEWIMWIDYDSIIMDVNFVLSFDRYVGKDLVLWGQEKQLYEEGDSHMGLNTGVFLVRNSEWSRAFFNETCQYGHQNGKKYEALMKSRLSKYSWAMFDQNGFAYNLNYWRPEESRAKTYLERSFILNGYWKDLPLDQLSIDPHELRLNRSLRKYPFVKHFMGCQFCSGVNTDAEIQSLCQKDFVDTFNKANELVINATFSGL
ncbi:hypothetical protein MIR68_002992 [Amoeboaphelidium protococcarum]|nr:hypothetical protein MIR68_002992 [Amoeboaphelidium protococcarum]